MNMKAPIGQRRRMREAIKQEQIRNAAPALLAALKAMLRLHDSESADDAATKEWTLNQARAAIAAAEGE